MRTIVVISSVGFALQGCAAHRPTRGVVRTPSVGHHYFDFSFLDEEGRHRSLRNSLGDFTILAFTRCDSSTHTVTSRLLDGLVAEHRDNRAVTVVGIDVHWSAQRCSTHDHCHLLGAKRNTMSICDATGFIRRLYGVSNDDELILIGPDRRVIATATASYPDRLQHQLAIDVTRFASRIYATQPQELGD